MTQNETRISAHQIHNWMRLIGWSCLRGGAGGRREGSLRRQIHEGAMRSIEALNKSSKINLQLDMFFQQESALAWLLTWARHSEMQKSAMAWL
jgi:hypothetical protein